MLRRSSRSDKLAKHSISLRRRRDGPAPQPGRFRGPARWNDGVSGTTLVDKGGCDGIRNPAPALGRGDRPLRARRAKALRLVRRLRAGRHGRLLRWAPLPDAQGGGGGGRRLRGIGPALRRRPRHAARRPADGLDDGRRGRLGAHQERPLRHEQRLRVQPRALDGGCRRVRDRARPVLARQCARLVGQHLGVLVGLRRAPWSRWPAARSCSQHGIPRRARRPRRQRRARRRRA